jgi:hypothetical protein
MGLILVQNNNIKLILQHHGHDYIIKNHKYLDLLQIVDKSFSV